MRKRHTGVDSIGRRLAALDFSSYAEYLSSPHWLDVRCRFYESIHASRNCGMFCCGACLRTDVSLSLHHRTYKRLGKERLGDLIAVCAECHRLMHKFGASSNVWGATLSVINMRRAEREGRPTSFATSTVVRNRETDPPF